MTSTSLSTDIIRLIINYVIGEKGTAQYYEASIPLLAINREWRSIVVPLFYTSAYFWSYKRRDYRLQFTNTSPVAQTNIGLIFKNGYGDSVKNLVYSSHDKVHVADSLLHMAHMLDICVESCPELDSLMDHHSKYSNIEASFINESHILATVAIATTLAANLPNIRELDIDTDDAHDLIACFTSVLTDCFADNLAELIYNGPLRFSNGLPLIGLKTVYLSLNEGAKDQMYPAICPQSIQKLTIFADYLAFDWKLFSAEQDPKDIVFDQLEYLNCKSYNHDEDTAITAVERRLHFPNIKKMVTRGSALSIENIGRQLQFGLRDLHYLDILPNIMKLSLLDVSSLASLNLEFYGPYSMDESSEFVASTNTLFSRLKGIPAVWCGVHAGIAEFNMDGIYWPNLTRLSFDVGLMSGNIFEAVLNMPDLIYLEVNMRDFKDSTLLEYFNNLRASHTRPSGSKITMLKFRSTKQVHCDQLLSSIQVLKWYWPKLQTIDI